MNNLTSLQEKGENDRKVKKERKKERESDSKVSKLVSKLKFQLMT